MGRKCTSHKAEKGYRILVGKAIGKRVPERPRRMRKNNIKTDLRKLSTIAHSAMYFFTSWAVVFYV